MGDEPTPPAVRPWFRERVLKTAADAVSAERLDDLRAFCEGDEDVAAGYVCSVEQSKDDSTWNVLRFAVKLLFPVDAPGDSRDVSQKFAKQFHERHQELMGEVGLRVLADRAVPAWDKNALRLFARR